MGMEVELPYFFPYRFSDHLVHSVVCVGHHRELPQDMKDDKIVEFALNKKIHDNYQGY